MEFPDYIIPTKDERFEITYVWWALSVLTELGSNPYGHEFNENIITRYAKPISGRTKNQSITTALIDTYDLMKKSVIDETLLCVDSTVYKYDFLSEFLTNFRSKNPTFECEMRLFTAFELSNLLSTKSDTSDEELIIDRPIPDVNVIALTFVGTKDSLGVDGEIE